MKLVKKILPAFLALFATASLAGPTHSVAIIGDSLSTGAAAHPSLAFDSNDLWDVFMSASKVRPSSAHVPNSSYFKLVDPLKSPTLLWPSNREFRGGFDWIIQNLLIGTSTVYLNTEEYSWGYLAASHWGVKPSNILISAQNGAKVSSFSRQIDRILDHTGSQLPSKTFVFYTGNDICAPSVDFITAAEDYGSNLETSMKYLIRNSNASQPSDVYIMSHLSVLQILFSEEVMNKKVKAHGTQKTCRKLREESFTAKEPYLRANLPPEAAYFSQIMPPNPTAMCRTLFADTKATEAISVLANRIRDYRTAAKQAVENVNKYLSESNPESRVRFHYLSETENIVFSADEMAVDCFHISAHGHAKLADVIIKAVSKSQHH